MSRTNDIMKTHIHFLQQLQDISPLLAARSLFSFEGEYVHDAQESGIRVVEAQDQTNTRIVVLDGFADPVLTAIETDDDLSLVATHDLQQSPSLCAMLSAMGLQAIQTEDGFSLKASFTKDEMTQNGLDLPRIEALWNRVLSLESLWMANRRLSQFDKDHDRVTANLLKIYEKAHAWETRRLIDFDGDPRKANPRATEKIIEELTAATQWGVPGLVGIQIHSDPRGSAFELQFEGSYNLGVVGLQVAWPAAPLFKGSQARKPVTVSKGKYAITPTKIKPEVLAVLDGLIVEGMTVRIVQRLSKGLYAKVNEMLNTIGGQWHTGAQAHIFEDDPRDLIEEMVATGAVYTRKDFEFFETTADLSQRVISHADLKFGLKTLEPNAGLGALAVPAAKIVGIENVTCIELMERNVKHLQALGFGITQSQDFLEVPAQAVYDRILLNPPFSAGRDAAHIQHAYANFLAPGGRLVAIASTQWQTHTTAPAKAFQAFLAKLDAKVEQIEAGAFKESGTDVPTTLIVLCKPMAKRVTTSVAEQVDLFTF